MEMMMKMTLKLIITIMITAFSSISLGAQSSYDIEKLEQEIQIMIAEVQQKQMEMQFVDSQIQQLEAEIDSSNISSIAAK